MWRRLWSSFLAAVLCLSPGFAQISPVNLVTEIEAADTANRDFVTLEKKNSNIAPGITQEIATVRKKYNQEQLVYYTMTVDTNNQNAKIFANYKDNDWKAVEEGHYGFQTVKEQMDAAQAKHSNPDDQENYVPNYTVVGGINGTGYDMSTGETQGILVMEGHYVHPITNSPFFAIHNDGSPHIYWNGPADYEAHKNEIKEALDSFGSPLIKNGVIQNSDWGPTEPNVNARTAIGITDNGKVVMLVVDGKQKPVSEGCDMYELALILQKAGCVDAFNLDGGGSTTFVSRPEGESEYRVVSKPCDGEPRSVSASLLVVSTEPASDTFDHASITAENDYITPGTSLKLSAKGISPAGTPVEIPADVTWQCDEADGSLEGTGSSVKFTASNSLETEDKEVTIVMKQQEKEVGSFKLHVVKPNHFKFSNATYMIPYGKSMDFTFQVLYKQGDEEHTVLTHEGDIVVSLDEGSEGLGSINGLNFMACESGSGASQKGSVTAVLSCTGASDQAQIELGRGSETVIDFEDPSQQTGFDGYEVSITYHSPIKVSLANKENGLVHGGEHAMKVEIDWRYLRNPVTESGIYGQVNALAEEVFGAQTKNLADAKSIGAWVWVPDEDELTDFYIKADTVATTTNHFGTDHDEGHWVYVQSDVSNQDKSVGLEKFSFMLRGQSDTNKPFISNTNNRLTYYIDDITVDYSPVIPDRGMPEFGEVKLVKEGDDFDALKKDELFDAGSRETFKFSAEVSDHAESAATGIDSVEAFIDGNPLKSTYANGQINTEEIKPAPGVHSLKLSAVDGAGNRTDVIRKFKVNANTTLPAITLEPGSKNRNEGLIPINSVYYFDVKASDISTVQEVSVDIDLANLHDWKLDHADVNPKFDLKWEFKDGFSQGENIATITLTRKTPCSQGDTDILASLPVQVWGEGFPFDYYYVPSKVALKDVPAGTPLSTWSVQDAWNAGYFYPIEVTAEIDRGLLTCLDQSQYTFSSDLLREATELNDYPKNVKDNNPGKTGWHEHQTAEPIDDQDPTCMTKGWKGRRECPICHSPIAESDWGEVLDVIAHEYEINKEGKLACKSCHELFSGEYEGKTYQDGICLQGWQDNGSYYQDGKIFKDGIYQTEDVVGSESVKRYHAFDQDGLCLDKEDGYTGFYKEENETLTPIESLPEKDEELDKDCYHRVEGGLPVTTWLFLRADGSTSSSAQSDKESTGDPDLQQSTDSQSSQSDSQSGDSGITDKDEQQAVLDTKAYHIVDGLVHRVTSKDTRQCTVSGYIEYTCTKCNETKESERLWWPGHQWDIHEDGTRTCKVCHIQGKDISQASLNIMGKLFDYTGEAVRAAVYVYHDGESLSVRCDKNGHDGYVWYENNTDIGTATVHIRGEGDYYGELTGTFEIVPQSVKKVTFTHEPTDDPEKLQVNLTWDASKGADYYQVYRYDQDAEKWIIQETIEPAFSEILPIGTDYQYVVASRAKRTEADGQEKIYYCALWSDYVLGTLDHDWSERAYSKQTTCEEDGLYTIHCKSDSAQKTVEEKAFGHTVNKWETIEPATTAKAGVKQGTCETCGKVITEEIPKLPYTPSGGGSGSNNSSSSNQNNQNDQSDQNQDSEDNSPDSDQPVTNPDGSTSVTIKDPEGNTTTQTNYVDGTREEKTVSADGSKTTTKTEFADGTREEKVENKDGSSETITTKTDGSIQQVVDNKEQKTTVNVEASGSTSQIVEAKAVDGSTSQIKGELNISEEKIKQAAEAGSNVTITMPEIPADRIDDKVQLDVVLPEEVESATIEIPVDADTIEPGSVAMVEDEQGNLVPIPESIGKDGKLIVPLSKNCKIIIKDNKKNFLDVTGPTTDYPANGIAFLSARNLMTGVGDGTSFDLTGKVTRAQLATILFRQKGEPNTDNLALPEGVAEGDYFSKAAKWAKATGLMGVGSAFNAGNLLTREQLAMILWRVEGTPDTGGVDFSRYSDANSISSPEMQKAVGWAVQSGLMGQGTPKLNASGSSQRQELAAMLSRYLQK